MAKDEFAERLLAAIAASAEPQTIQYFSERLGYQGSHKFPKLVQKIAQLEQQKQITISADGKVAIVKNETTVQGSYIQNGKGFGFVRVEGQADDVFIPRGKANGAMNGDTVVVEITSPKKEWDSHSASGQVIQIINHQITRLTGEFTPFDANLRQETHFIGLVKPQNKGFDNIGAFILPDGLKPVEGEIVVVEIAAYPTSEEPFRVEGRVIKKIGHKDEPGVDILAILNMFEIPHEFSQDVIDEAEAVADEISTADLAGRQDLREVLTITIDGADAKDLDDAISLKRLSNGNYELGVHIADVSYYVTPGSALDREALLRGTSVYLTDRVVPMLPPRLSNGICSLHPNVERLTMSCIMEIDQYGEVLKHHISPSVIFSDYRMTYDDVNAILGKDNPGLLTKYEEIVPMLEEMAELHEILLAKRVRRGAINFDAPEAEIEVDREGRPLAIYLRERGTGERLIESFMLSANETVAHHYDQLKLPFVYRIHEQPDEDRMQRFLEFVTTFGIMLPGTKGTIKPKDLQQTLETIKDEPYQQVVTTMLLRSMKQARYDVEPVGHYGLAATDYTHFTSPIRRYPDLMVHRLIRRFIGDKPQGEEVDQLREELFDVALHSSVMERRSVDAERETDSLKKTEFMADKVGQIFAGIVSSVTNFGLFVELENTVEGLVHISTMNDDYYNYVPSHLVLIGERTGATYRIGDQVQVKLTKADVDTREIDFELVISETDKKTRKAAAAEQSKARKGKHKGQQNRAKRPARGKQPAAQKAAAKPEQDQGKKKKNKKNKRSFVIRKKS